MEIGAGELDERRSVLIQVGFKVNRAPCSPNLSTPAQTLPGMLDELLMVLRGQEGKPLSYIDDHRVLRVSGGTPGGSRPNKLNYYGEGFKKKTFLTLP